MSVISRNTLKIAALATSDDTSRYTLNAVRVEPDGRCVATDGHILVIAKDGSATPDADFPVVPGLPENVNGSAGAVHIPTGIISRLIKAMPTKSTLPILTMARIGATPDGQAYAAATDLEAPTVAKIAELNGQFPQYERVMVKDGQRAHVIKLTLSAEILATLAKMGQLAASHSKSLGAVTLEIPVGRCYRDKGTANINSAVRFTTGTPSSVLVEGAIMPCRVWQITNQPQEKAVHHDRQNPSKRQRQPSGKARRC